MPNWCENHLSITGQEDDVKKILEIIETPVENGGEYNIIENLYPTPEDLNIGHAPMNNLTDQQIANKEKYGYTDWYQWRIDKWGTKWPDSDTRSESEPIIGTSPEGISTIAFGFETPWGPPIEAFHKISSDYPNLLFCLYYEEPGMGFCGKNVWANGEEVESEESELVSSYFDEDYLYEHYFEKKDK